MVCCGVPYEALVAGVPAGPRGTISGRIGRDPRDRLRMALLGPNTGATAPGGGGGGGSLSGKNAVSVGEGVWRGRRALRGRGRGGGGSGNGGWIVLVFNTYVMKLQATAVEMLVGSLMVVLVVAAGGCQVTHYEVAAAFAGCAHLRLVLETGRTHQIRVHCSADPRTGGLGAPLLGDAVYGGPTCSLGGGGGGGGGSGRHVAALMGRQVRVLFWRRRLRVFGVLRVCLRWME